MPQSSSEREETVVGRMDRPAMLGRRRRAIPDGIARALVVAVASATLLPLAGLLPATATAFTPTLTDVAAALIEREMAIAERVRSVAETPATRRLVDGIDGAADRRLASRTLVALRGNDGEMVRNACLMRVGVRGRTPLDGGLGDANAVGCIRKDLREAAAAGGDTQLVRDVGGLGGGTRMWLATAVTGAGAQDTAILSVDVDLPRLLSGVLATEEGQAAAIVDLGTLGVLAATERLPDGATSPVAPDRLDAAIGAARDNSGGPADDGALQAGVAPLWKLADGRRLGLVDVPTGITPPAGSGGLDGPIMLAGAVVVVLLLSVIGVGLRRSRRRTEARARVQSLYRDAYSGPGHDGLTGVGDQHTFRDAMAARMAVYFEHGVPFALAVVDIDDLAAVNDYDGNEAGDEVLIGAAETLEQLGRPEDEVFRLVSDDFAVILPELDTMAAVESIERALHVFRRPPSGIRPGSFSAGVSAVPQFSTDGAIVETQARTALAWVKEHGRGAVEAYDPERDRVPDQPHDAANQAVREVVSGRLLSPVYQPIVDLRNGRVLGFEGLVRPDPGGPLPSTSHLFAAASASGRTVELDLACIEVVLAGARDIQTDRLITLNLSPRTLEVKGFSVSWLLDSILRNGIAPGRVIVELTERDAIGDMRKLQQTFSTLQQYGLRLAADDVGAGNAGLRLLSQVRFDIVKIDLSLVQDGVHEPRSRAVLESLRDLATSQESNIVAEGVETPEQLQVIRDLRIAAAQGYLLGRPNRSVETSFVDLRRLVPDSMSPTTLPPAGVALPAPPGLDRPAAEPGPFATSGWGLGSAGAARRR